MDVDILTLYGPGMSFYRSQIQLSSSKENGIVGKAELSSLSVCQLQGIQQTGNRVYNVSAGTNANVYPEILLSS